MISCIIVGALPWRCCTLAYARRKSQRRDAGASGRLVSKSNDAALGPSPAQTFAAGRQAVFPLDEVPLQLDGYNVDVERAAIAAVGWESLGRRNTSLAALHRAGQTKSKCRRRGLQADVDFSNVPSTANLIYDGFPARPPTVSIVVPNLCDDMHDCSTQTGDTWLSKNLPAILAYDAAHDGLLILTWDEAAPDANGKNQIATLLVGPMVRPGKYAQNVDHYGVLHTIESVVGVRCTANACTAPILKNLWK